MTTAMLEDRGMTQDYIDKIKPIGIVMSAIQVEVANGESCSGLYSLVNLLNKYFLSRLCR